MNAAVRATIPRTIDDNPVAGDPTSPGLEEPKKNPA
jgi:hypothetical protein